MSGPADDPRDALDELLQGGRRLVVRHAASTGPQFHSPAELPNAIVFPGAFNPLHDGHRQMAELASRRLGDKIYFEISVKNVDKPGLERGDVERRAAQFDCSSLCFTNAPTFVEKADLFPAAIFLVGVDTLARIAEARYYTESAESAFEALFDRGCRFMVFGRLVAGRFQTLRDVEAPPALRRLCDSWSEAEFRADISSTELRRANRSDT